MIAMGTVLGPAERTQLPEKVSKSISTVQFRCEECDRLWSEHAKATFEHIYAENRFKLASLEHCVNAIEELTQSMEEALRHREYTREAIHRHGASHP